MLTLVSESPHRFQNVSGVPDLMIEDPPLKGRLEQLGSVPASQELLHDLEGEALDHRQS